MRIITLVEMKELKDICSEVLDEMRQENNNSCIAWVGGTANDYLKGKEPYDYDLIVYGISYKKIANIFKDEIHVNRTVPEAGVIRGKAPSGKKIDVYLATRTYYSSDIGNWKWDTDYYDFLLEKNYNHKKVIKHSINCKVPRFSNNCVYIHFPSMDIVTKNEWYRDFQNKNCQFLRERSKYVIIDYITFFKYLANGYTSNERTKNLFVKNSLIPYLSWNDQFDDDDLISIYQDIFLRNLKRVYQYKNRNKYFDKSKFYWLCEKSKLFSSLFYNESVKEPEDLKTKEDFVLNVYGNDKKLLYNDIGEKFIIKNKFSF